MDDGIQKVSLLNKIYILSIMSILLEFLRAQLVSLDFLKNYLRNGMVSGVRH
jgi:riboflavin transporter FmnP